MSDSNDSKPLNDSIDNANGNNSMADSDQKNIINPELALVAAAEAQQDTAINEQKQTKATVSDPSVFGNVAVVYGGNSNERSVSLDSGAAVLKALQNQGVNATHFDPKKQDITELRKFDRVFNVLHGRGGEDGLLQGVLQWFNIPQCLFFILIMVKGAWHFYLTSFVYIYKQKILNRNVERKIGNHLPILGTKTFYV